MARRYAFVFRDSACKTAALSRNTLLEMTNSHPAPETSEKLGLWAQIDPIQKRHLTMSADPVSRAQAIPWPVPP